MEITERRTADIVTLNLSGRLDTTTAKTFEKKFLGQIESGDRRFIDLRLSIRTVGDFTRGYPPSSPGRNWTSMARSVASLPTVSLLSAGSSALARAMVSRRSSVCSLLNLVIGISGEFGSTTLSATSRTRSMIRNSRELFGGGVVSVTQCTVLLAVMGKNWLEARNDAGKRSLDDPRDYLRIEVETALQRDIPVIPVLVQGASMPREEDLPASLQPLAFRNAVAVRPDPDFRADIDRLINGIQQHLGTRS